MGISCNAAFTWHPERRGLQHGLQRPFAYQKNRIISHTKGKEEERMGRYSQFFQIGKVLEYIGWELRDVVHAEVTVETRHQLETRQQEPGDFVALVVKMDIF